MVCFSGCGEALRVESAYCLGVCTHQPGTVAERSRSEPTFERRDARPMAGTWPGYLTPSGWVHRLEVVWTARRGMNGYDRAAPRRIPASLTHVPGSAS